MYRTSDDGLGPLTTYGRHVLQLGESHDLFLLNGLLCYLDLKGFMCFVHNGGASLVDYDVANQQLLPHI